MRDWLNEHPFRNEPNARLICNLRNWFTIKAESIVEYDETIKEENNEVIAKW